MARLISGYRNSKYMTKEDLVHPVVLTVIKIVDEVMPNDNEIKPVAHFAEAVVDGITIKPCVLNQGNLEMLGQIAGIKDLEKWPTRGVRAEFYNLESYEYRDKSGTTHRGAIRVRPAPTTSAGPGATDAHAYADVRPKPRTQPAYASGNDARDGVLSSDMELDDKIPF